MVLQWTNISPSYRLNHHHWRRQPTTSASSKDLAQTLAYKGCRSADYTRPCYESRSTKSTQPALPRIEGVHIDPRVSRCLATFNAEGDRPRAYTRPFQHLMPKVGGILNESQTVGAPQGAIGAVLRIYFHRSLYIRHTILMAIVPRWASITPPLSVVPIAFGFTWSQGRGKFKELSTGRTKNMVNVPFLGSMRFDIAYTACNLSNHYTGNSHYSIDIVGIHYSSHLLPPLLPTHPLIYALSWWIPARDIYTTRHRKQLLRRNRRMRKHVKGNAESRSSSRDRENSVARTRLAKQNLIPTRASESTWWPVYYYPTEQSSVPGFHRVIAGDSQNGKYRAQWTQSTKISSK